MGGGDDVASCEGAGCTPEGSREYRRLLVIGMLVGMLVGILVDILVSMLIGMLVGMLVGKLVGGRSNAFAAPLSTDATNSGDAKNPARIRSSATEAAKAAGAAGTAGAAHCCAL